MAAIVTLLTDFGLSDPFVGIMKGVILGIAPDVRLVDLTHTVPPQQVMTGALQLSAAVPYFPAGTIHLAVVDPGVGSDRRAVVVHTEAGLLVGPDNGLLSLAAQKLGVRQAYAIENDRYLRHPVSKTFHGRDVFASVTGHLASGVPVDTVGRAISGLKLLAMQEPRSVRGGLAGEVIHVDTFGNLITNIPVEALGSFSGRDLSVSICGVQIPSVSSTYADVPEGGFVALIGSRGLLEISVRNASAAQALAATAGTPLLVAWESSRP